MRLAFVTGNPGKFKEASHELDGLAQLEQDTDGYTEIQADTLQEVAAAGLDEVGKRLDPPYFLEDAGLFLDALGGFPGVYSAYAYKTLGCEGLLRLMFDHRDPESRRAHFEAVVAYRDPDGRDHFFTGKAQGTIADDQVGDEGFGFDPIFIPLGKKQTFAQMGLDAKGKVSHRGKAMAAFRKHLEQHPLPEGEASTLPSAPAPSPSTQPKHRAPDPADDQGEDTANAPAAMAPKHDEPTTANPKAAPKSTKQAKPKKRPASPSKSKGTKTTKKPTRTKPDPSTEPRRAPDDEHDDPGKSSRGIVTVLDDDDEL